MIKCIFEEGEIMGDTTKMLKKVLTLSEQSEMIAKKISVYDLKLIV